MTTIELSANQRHVLEMARNTSGYVEDYPTGLLGGARTSVVRALLRNELVEAHDAGYRVTAAGYAAIGAEPPQDADIGRTESTAAPNLSEPNGVSIPSETATSETAEPVAPSKPKRAARGDTKLATVVGLLMRPEGATIAQIMAATEWQQHSVRGFLAGTVKKKGYTVTNSKEGDSERVYRIAAEDARLPSADIGTQGDEEE